MSVIWFQQGGARGPMILLGGPDFDGLRAITAVGDRFVVGGFFSGSMRLGDRVITAGGGDDAFLAAPVGRSPHGSVAIRSFASGTLGHEM